MGAMSEATRSAHVGISGAETRSPLDTSITDALARLDARGRKRQQQAQTQRVVTDDMPLGLQVHLLKMGARDERTQPADEDVTATLVRSQRGSIHQRVEDNAEGDEQPDGE